jgi:DNA repair photolyase
MNLDRVAAAAAKAGARSFHGGLLFLKPCAQRVFFPFLEEQFPQLVDRYKKQYAKGAYLKGEYPKLIEARVAVIRKRYGLIQQARESGPVEPQSGDQMILF